MQHLCTFLYKTPLKPTVIVTIRHIGASYIQGGGVR